MFETRTVQRRRKPMDTTNFENIRPQPPSGADPNGNGGWPDDAAPYYLADVIHEIRDESRTAKENGDVATVCIFEDNAQAAFVHGKAWPSDGGRILAVSIPSGAKGYGKYFTDTDAVIFTRGDRNEVAAEIRRHAAYVRVAELSGDEKSISDLEGFETAVGAAPYWGKPEATETPPADPAAAEHPNGNSHNNHAAAPAAQPEGEAKQESAPGSKPELLEPDAGEIAKFVDALFRYATRGAYASLRSFYQHEDRPFTITAAKVGASLELVVKEAVILARTSAQNPVAVVCCPPVATFDNPRKATEANIVDGLVISAELDENPTAAIEALKKVLGEPTVVVRSGGTWTDLETGEVQDKLHVYWRLKTPARKDARKDLKRAQILACKIAGGDPSDKTIVHPLRWPGSWHRKGEPVLCRMAACNPDIEIDLTSALARLEEVCPQEKAKVTSGGDRDYEQQEGGETATLIHLVLTSESYHEPLTRLAARFLGARMVDGAVVNALRGLMMNAAGPKDARWQQRYASIPRAVRTAREKINSGEWKDPAAGGETKAETWPEPDLGVLRLHRRPAVPFPIDIFGNKWGAWVTNAANSKAAPVDYVASTLLSSASALIGHARWAQAWNGWTEPPHLWACDVGDSGDGKSPGADTITKEVIPEIQCRMTRDFPDQLQEARKIIEIAKARQDSWKAEVKAALIHVRNMQRKVRLPGLTTAEAIHGACNALIEAGWLGQPPTVGLHERKREAYPVSPRLKEVLP
jgi:hypothetical protein